MRSSYLSKSRFAYTLLAYMSYNARGNIPNPDTTSLRPQIPKVGTDGRSVTPEKFRRPSCCSHANHPTFSHPPQRPKSRGENAHHERQQPSCCLNYSENKSCVNFTISIVSLQCLARTELTRKIYSTPLHTTHPRPFNRVEECHLTRNIRPARQLSLIDDTPF